MPVWFAGSRLGGACGVRPDDGGGEVPGGLGPRPLTLVSWLDWKLGARLLLKYPALTIIGGLSLAAAIAIGVVGIEVAGELL